MTLNSSTKLVSLISFNCSLKTDDVLIPLIVRQSQGNLLVNFASRVDYRFGSKIKFVLNCS